MTAKPKQDHQKKPKLDLRRTRQWPENLPMPEPAPDRTGQSWTEEELALVRKYHRRYGSRYLSRLLGRKASAIRNQAYKMGIASSPRIAWNPFEINYLKKNHQQRSIKAITRTLGRSEQAVRARLRS